MHSNWVSMEFENGKRFIYFFFIWTKIKPFSILLSSYLQGWELFRLKDSNRIVRRRWPSLYCPFHFHRTIWWWFLSPQEKPAREKREVICYLHLYVSKSFRPFHTIYFVLHVLSIPSLVYPIAHRVISSVRLSV